MPAKTSKAAVKPLERKITPEESMEGFLTVEKAWLRRLPALGKPFYLKLGKSDLKVQIEGYACTCRGEEKPHEHYKINLPLVTLVTGTNATLRVINDEKVVLEIEE